MTKYSLSIFVKLFLGWKDLGDFKFSNRMIMREAADLDQVRHHLEGVEGSDVLESVENTEGGPEILGPQETLGDGGEVGGEVTEDHPHLVHAERLVMNLSMESDSNRPIFVRACYESYDSLSVQGKE